MTKKRNKTPSSQKNEKHRKIRKSETSCSAILSRKENRLNWHDFNFLENLLIFCTMPERRVPKESGVHFSISSSPTDKSLIILFKTDRKEDPLFTEGEKRPDYMTLYVKENTCICTIIEMKGTEQKKLRHGIRQIVNLKKQLQKEIKKHLPTKFKLIFQGILLTPPNSQIPYNDILNIKDFVILPLQYPQKFELFNYISDENKRTGKYQHQPRGRDTLNFTESLLVNQTLHKRIEDSFYKEHFDSGKNREGMYVDFCCPNTDDYAVLFVNKNAAIISADGKNFSKDIKRKLHHLGIQNIFKFETIEP